MIVEVTGCLTGGCLWSVYYILKIHLRHHFTGTLLTFFVIVVCLLLLICFKGNLLKKAHKYSTIVIIIILQQISWFTRFMGKVQLCTGTHEIFESGFSELCLAVNNLRWCCCPDNHWECVSSTRLDNLWGERQRGWGREREREESERERDKERGGERLSFSLVLSLRARSSGVTEWSGAEAAFSRPTWTWSHRPPWTASLLLDLLPRRALVCLKNAGWTQNVLEAAAVFFF